MIVSALANSKQWLGTGVLLRASVLVAWCLIALTGCGRGAAHDPDGERSSGGGGAGTLVVYAAGPRHHAEALVEEFTARTGVKVELFSATTGQIMAKLEAERFNRRADVVMLASRIAAEHLKREERLVACVPTRAGNDPTSIDPAWIDPDGWYASPSGAAVGIAIRKRSDGHGSSGADHHTLEWDGALRGASAGRAVMPSPSKSGATGEFVLAMVLADEANAWASFEAASQAGMEFASANSHAIAGLLSGSYEMIIGAVDYLILREIERGAPVELIFPASGAPIVERPVVVLRGTRHEAEARSFVETCFSEAGQRLAREAWLIPADLSERARGQRVMPTVVMEIDPERGLERLGRVVRRFQYDIERPRATSRGADR